MVLDAVINKCRNIPAYYNRNERMQPLLPIILLLCSVCVCTCMCARATCVCYLGGDRKWYQEGGIARQGIGSGIRRVVRV